MSTKGLPFFLSGLVVKGFGRGSKALGTPTANLEDKVVDSLPTDFKTGVYYGWACIDTQVYKMVASVGWNPFYKNEKKTVEIHLLHKFENDFYGKQIKAIFTGYIRPEKDFASEVELIKAIKHDIEFAKEQLQQPNMIVYKDNQFFIGQ
ncbi:riboflavin kinase [Xylocopa sonorina]|uniref:riboflavin kinase n=1 Tax=Xylocopa sonorina TaxID=1818115 RepID=UPI00403AAF69